MVSRLRTLSYPAPVDTVVFDLRWAASMPGTPFPGKIWGRRRRFWVGKTLERQAKSCGDVVLEKEAICLAFIVVTLFEY